MYPSEYDIELVRDALHDAVRRRGRLSSTSLLWSQLLDELISAYMRKQDLFGTSLHVEVLTLLGDLSGLRTIVPSYASAGDWQEFVDDVFLPTLETIENLYKDGVLGLAEYNLGLSALEFLHAIAPPPVSTPGTWNAVALRSESPPLGLGLMADALVACGFGVRMVPAASLSRLSTRDGVDLTLTGAAQPEDFGEALRIARASYHRTGKPVIVCGAGVPSAGHKIPAYVYLIGRARMADMLAFAGHLQEDVIANDT